MGHNIDSCISVSLQIAFICSGANYAQYEKVLGSLGMHPVSDQMFYEIIQVLYAPVKTLLDSQCELGKREMQSAPTDQIGSWNRAVTVGDGVWQTRCHHSQNFTFHIRDHVRNSVLYYLHLCQRACVRNLCTKVPQDRVKVLALAGYSVKCIRKACSIGRMQILALLMR